MKKITHAVFVMVITTLASCSTNTSQTADTLSQQDTVTEAEHHHEENGAKWKADSISRVNVEVMQNIVGAAKPATLDEYHITGTKIQDAIIKLLKDCRMQGPDHEALHRWLKPVIEADHQLLESKSAEEAAPVFSEMKKHINMYSQYFE